MIENCVICENKIYKNRMNSFSGKTRRGNNWVTCSPECSKIYGRKNTEEQKNLKNIQIMKQLKEAEKTG